MTAIAAAVQHLEIVGWLPAPNSNVHADGWRKRQVRLKAAQVMVWAAAKQAEWTPVPGRAKLTVTFVFGQHRRRDTDNLYSRAKGLIDGLRGATPSTIGGFPRTSARAGWIVDDSTEWLELVVKAEVSKEWNGTKITLEALA